jgi:hypothetical protein
MHPFLLGAAGLALVLVPLVVVLRRRRARPEPPPVDPLAVDALRRRCLSWPKPPPVLPALRAAHAPLPWERAFWRRAPKNGGRRG